MRRLLSTSALFCLFAGTAAAQFMPSSTSPGSAIAGQGQIDSLVINGSSASPDTINSVTWIGPSGTVGLAFSSTANTVTVTIPANLLTTPGTATILINDTYLIAGIFPNNNTSGLAFQIAAPAISSITPTTAVAGTSGSLTLTVNGSNFLSGVSTVEFCPASCGTPTPLTTTFVNSGQLTATILPSSLAASGSVAVSVNNGASAPSNTKTFTITPIPTSTSVSAPTVSGSTFSLTATVSNTAAGASATPTGSVSFFDGSTFLGAASLVQSTGVTATATLSGIFTTTLPESVGHTVLFAQYPGTTSYGASSSSTVLSLIAKGSAVFQAAASQPSLVSPNLLARGDFNGDGVIDLVTVSGTSLSVLTGNGDGTFTAAQVAIPTGSNDVFMGLAVGDLGTQHQDIFLLDIQNGTTAIVYRFSNNGMGSFNAAATTYYSFTGGAVSAAQNLRLADFQGTGYPQPVFALTSSGAESLYVITSAGSAITTGITAGATFISLGNDESTGVPYVITGSASAIRVWVSQGNGTFSNPYTLTGSGFVSATTANIYNSSAHDLIVTTTTGLQIYRYVSPGVFASSATASISAGVAIQSVTPTRLTALNTASANNPVDLIATAANSSAYVYLNNGSGTLTAAGYSPIGVGTQPNFLVAGDFNGDGRQDFATLNQGSGTLSVLLGSIPVITSSTPVALVATSTPSITLNGPFFSSTRSSVAITGTSGSTIYTGTINAGSSTPGALNVAVPAAAVSTIGSITLTVTDQTSNTTSAAFTVPVIAPPTLSSTNPLTPQYATLNQAAFNITISGSNFPATTPIVNFKIGSTTSALTVVSSTSGSIVATVPASDLTVVGTATISVTDPVSGASSGTAPLIIASGPQVTSISPASVGAGGNDLALTITGADFLTGDIVVFTEGGNSFNYTPSQINQGNASLTVTIPAAQLASPGSASISVKDGTGAGSGIATLTIASPTVSAILPTGTTAGTTSAITLTVSGTNFIPGTSNVTWCNSCNGVPTILVPNPSPAPTTTQLTVTVPTNLLATAGTAQIGVVNGTSASSSGTQPFNIGAVSISSINPSSVAAGSPGQSLTVSGTNFISGSTVVLTSGSTPLSLATTFVSSTQLQAVIPASALTGAAAAFITVQVGSASSNAASLSILAPTITGIAPSTSPTGASTFTIIVSGSNYLTTSIVQWANGTGAAQALTTSFTGVSSLIAVVPNSLVATSGTALVTVVNSALNAAGSTSNGEIFTIGPAPTINTDSSGVSPNTAPVGSSATQIAIGGANFQSGSTVYFNNGTNTALSTGFVSSTALTATIPSSLLVSAGTALLTVQNPGPVTSNAINFTIAPGITPSVVSLNPQNSAAGGPLFQIILTGTNLSTGSVIEWNSGTTTTALTTSYASGQLSAIVPAALIATAGTAFVSVTNPGNLQSNSLQFSISSTQPAINAAGGLSPANASVGSSSFTLLISGSNFVSGSTVMWNGGSGAQSLLTVFGTSTSLTAVVPTSYLATPGSVLVTVSNPASTSGGAASVSNASIFTILPAAAPTINTIMGVAPSSATVGAPAFLINISGTNFFSGSVVQWNSGTTTTALATSYITSTQLSAVVTAALVTAAGSSFVSVLNPGNVASNLVSFTISTAAGPTLISLAPAVATAGGAAFQMLVTGTNFATGSAVQWNGVTGSTALATTVLNSTQLSALVPANLIAASGVAFVSVANTGGVTSNVQSFTISPAATPSITTWGGLSPATATVGSSSITLSVSGSNFTTGSVVEFNTGSAPAALATIFISSSQLTAIVPASDLSAAGTAFISVSNGAGNVSNSVLFPISAAGAPTIASPGGLTPATATTGPAGITITVTGTNFLPTSTVQWNAGTTPTALATIYASSTQLSAIVPAALLANSATVLVTVSNGTNNVSNAVAFTVSAPGAPTISAVGGLAPSSIAAGSAAFQLTVTGGNFVQTSVVQWNNGTTTQALGTVYLSATQLTALIPATLIATAGTSFVDVMNTGSTSNVVPFSISAATAPTINATGGLSPVSAIVGSTSIQLNVLGGNFIPTSVVQWNTGSGTQTLATVYVSSSQLSALVPTSLLTAAGTAFVSVSNGNGVVSNTIAFPISAPGNPTISTTNGLLPASASAGGASFQLVIIGTNFVSGSVVYWNAGTPQALTSSFVSSNQLTAVIPAALIASSGVAFISIQNPGPVNSNSVPFTIGASASLPTISSSGGLLPSSAPAGSATFQLMVTGTNFQNGAVVQWNAGGTAQALTTGFGNSTTLTALIPATLVAAPGISLISVLNPDKNVSNAVTFSIAGSVPVLTQLSPSSAPAGSQGISLIVTGTGFATGSTIYFGTTPLPTTFSSATQLNATIGSAQLVAAGSVNVSVQSAGGTSNAVSFAVGAPVITLINPTTVTSGAPAFTLTVGGDNFVSGASINFGGTALTTVFVTANQLTGAVPATLIAAANSVNVTVVNPGGVTSAAYGFSVGALPSIATIAPTTAPPGSAAFTLQITGSNFFNGDTVQWNGVALTTTYASATSLSAQVPATLLTASGNVNVSVLHAGGVVSNAVQFTISPATVTSILPVSAPAGSATLQLTVNGTAFVNGSAVQWNGTAVPTTFVSATQLSANINSTLLQAPGNSYVAVANPGGSLTAGTVFTVSGPTLTSISPTSATANVASLTITLTGTNFVTNSVVSWNGTTLPTSVASATQATAQVPSTLLTTAGTFVIVLTNPGGSATAAQFLTLAAPAAATVSSLTPTSAIAGGSAFQLTVAGSGFLAGSIVQWNGTALPTNYVGPTQLTVLVGAYLIASAGTDNVTVQVPGAALSAATAFPVNPPAITTLSPATVAAGGPTFTITVTGGNFIPGAVVQWNGTSLPTIYNSATQLTASVAGTLIGSGGTASVTVQNAVGAVSAASTFTIGPFTLAITTTSLPDGVVGTGYSQILTATGGSPPYMWAVTAGTLPDGIVLDPASGSLSGTPTAAVAATIGFTVTDFVMRTITKTIAFRTVTPLSITTATPLTSAPAGVPFSQILAATGGTAPYTWSLAGNLPPGLALNTSTGQISGTPTVPGAYNFSINIADSRTQSASTPFTETVTASGVTIGGITATSTSAQQLPVSVTIGSPYSANLTGTLTMVFTSAVGASDPAIQFSSGGLVANFIIPAGTTQAIFGTQQSVLLLTGTTAGTITVTASMQSGGASVTPATAPSITTTIAKAAPVISTVTLTASGTTLTVAIAGYSNTRDMTTGNLQFVAAAGSTLTAAPIAVPLTATFATYYQSAASNTGSQFNFSVPISFTGSISAVGSVNVTLVNSAGTSASVSATRQ